MQLNIRNQPKTEPIAEPTPLDQPAPSSDPGPTPSQPERSWLNLGELGRSARQALPVLHKRFGSLLLAFLVFYAMADYTEFTVGALHPGELVFSNTMIQLWTATYRMAYVYMAVLALLSITAPVLWAFYRPDGNQKFDLATFMLNHLSPTQQVWLFFVAFWLNCLLFILLLMVRLPESVNVGR
ncbi:hypothetical protein GO755_33440 [Spirosoma sp. HMF4905]|uniref:Uncharacterized protein n=1 Tax=Spirosoma arboris TaxID=2682092 RepID=A0A7K1SMF0_9BACT|nr:hypothetical protein [Spirosoma arboris]MVM34980.1 hypothetical protein [Spirosoma arboris]